MNAAQPDAIAQGLRARARQQAAVAELGQIALAGSDLTSLMDVAVALVTQALEVEYSTVLELLPDGHSLVMRAGVGWEDGLVGSATVGAGKSSQAGYTLLSNDPVVVEDLPTEPRFTASPLLRAHGVVSGMSVMIRGRNRPFGVLGAHTAERRTFSQDDVHFLQAVANVLAMAIERQGVELDLRESEARYRRLADDAEDVIYRYEFIHRRGFAYVNSAAERIIGYTPEEHYADPDLGLKIIHPDDLAQLAALVETGVPTGPIEQRWRHKDGRVVWTEQRNVPVYDADGTLVAVEGIARDITERKLAEAERERLLADERAARAEAEAERRRTTFLAQASALLGASLSEQEVLDHIGRMAVPELADCCVVDAIDEDGSPRLMRVEHVDERAAEVLRELRRRYPIDPDRPQASRRVVRTGESELCISVERSWREAAARDTEHLRLMDLVDCRSSLCAPLFARGRVLGALTFMVTGSARRYSHADLVLAEDFAHRCALALDNTRLYQRLRDTLAAREDFISSIVHDLRNPLTSVLGFTQHGKRLLRRAESVPAATISECLSRIEANAGRMHQMIGELLDTARLEAGQRLYLQRQLVDLVALVQRLAEERKQTTVRHRLRVESEVPELTGYWDEARLRRVLDNLVDNAIKYSPAGGEVLVRLVRERQAAVVEVIDRAWECRRRTWQDCFSGSTAQPAATTCSA